MEKNIFPKTTYRFYAFLYLCIYIILNIFKILSRMNKFVNFTLLWQYSTISNANGMSNKYYIFLSKEYSKQSQANDFYNQVILLLLEKIHTKYYMVTYSLGNYITRSFKRQQKIYLNLHNILYYSLFQVLLFLKSTMIF